MVARGPGSCNSLISLYSPPSWLDRMVEWCKTELKLKLLMGPPTLVPQEQHLITRIPILSLAEDRPNMNI